jgi:hypothetical protein
MNESYAFNSREMEVPNMNFMEIYQKTVIYKHKRKF